MNRGEKKRISILGVPLDRMSYDEAVRRAEVLLEAEGAKSIVTPNAEIIMMAKGNPELKKALTNSDMCFPDGIGVVIASRIMGEPLRGRTAGFDLMIKLFEMSNMHKRSVYLLGGKPGIAELAAINIKVKYPQICVSGTHHGYFTKEEEAKIIEDINGAKPSLLLIALGAPKQEIFMNTYKGQLRCGVMMGVGGSLDVLSGKVERAPVAWQKLGMEWLYRLIADPTRFSRVMVLPVFLIKITADRLSAVLGGSPKGS